VSLNRPGLTETNVNAWTAGEMAEVLHWVLGAEGGPP
jgi:hypothetical protein